MTKFINLLPEYHVCKKGGEMTINIDDEVIHNLSKYYHRELGYMPNKADIEAEVENIVAEFVEREERAGNV